MCSLVNIHTFSIFLAWLHTYSMYDLCICAYTDANDLSHAMDGLFQVVVENGGAACVQSGEHTYFQYISGMPSP